MKAKILSLFLAVTLLLSSSAYIVSASSGYDIYHWYSDSDSVRRWTQSTLNTYVATSSTYDSLNVTNLKSYISTSMLSWYFVGRGISYVSNKSDANWVLEGITRSEATSLFDRIISKFNCLWCNKNYRTRNGTCIRLCWSL